MHAAAPTPPRLLKSELAACRSGRDSTAVNPPADAGIKVNRYG